MSIQFFFQAVSSKCSVKYTSNCLLLDLSRLIDNLSRTSEFQILPGIFIVSNKSAKIPADIFEQVLVSNQSEKLNIYTYIQEKLQRYLDSLSITWRIMDRNSTFSVRQISEDLITELLPSTTTSEYLLLFPGMGSLFGWFLNNVVFRLTAVF